MNVTPELIQIAENAAARRHEFDKINSILTEKLNTVKNLLDTQKKLEEEASKQSDDWEKSLLASGGVEGEDSSRATLLTSLAQQKLERISPLIDNLRTEIIGLRYEEAKAARSYENTWCELRSEIIRPECKTLVNSLRETLEIVHGLFSLARLPDYEFDNLLSDLVRDIARKGDNAPALQYITEAVEDTANAISLWPGVFPQVMINSFNLSPSAGQMAVARDNPEKMRVLANGKELCKGLG